MKEKTMQGFRVIQKHQKKCPALKYVADGSWDHPWGVITKDYLSGTKVTPGAVRGSTQWFVVGCNIMGCPGQLAVRMDDVLRKAPVK